MCIRDMTITRRTRRLFARQQAILGKLNGHVEESVSGLAMVKAFCREREMIEDSLLPGKQPSRPPGNRPREEIYQHDGKKGHAGQDHI